MTALLLALLVAQPGDVYRLTEVTRNPDPTWEPETYEEWLAGEPDFEPLRITEIIGAEGPVEFLILLQEGWADSLGTGLISQWAADISGQGLTTEVLEISYSDPAELRDYFVSRLPEGLEGAVLVGNLPVPWCALEEPTWGDQEQFPTDYFYMDLDGVWQDNWIGYPSQGLPGQDGKYDTWDGDLDPEIYIGRMRTGSISNVGDPVELTQTYLQRNHEWRLTGDPEPLHALCYVDDDWAQWGPSYQNSMELLYPDVELVNDTLETNGTDYRDNRLPGDYVWISPYVHSSPTLHAWNPGPNTLWSDLVPANPPSRFYNLFACSNSRFTTPRNMGTIYAIATSGGLASIGSTKTGSMLEFTYFYLPLGQGGSMGEAFQAWWQHIAANGITDDEMAWHLGMSLIGDPTLMPAMHMLGIEGGTPFPGAVPDLRMWPNPASVSVNLAATGLEGQPAEVGMYDTSGRLVREAEMASSGTVSVILEGLEPGVYLVRMTCRDRAASASLVLLR